MSRERSSSTVLYRSKAWNSSARQSCGSICVTYGFHTSPNDSTSRLAIAGQSTAGLATTCALYEPTAPAILPRTSTPRIDLTWARMRCTTLASSLPTVVGVAGWPCVCESIGTSASSCAMPVSFVSSSASMGRRTSSRASATISAYDRLLMSSEVHAKWKNSSCDASAELAPPKCSLRKYSTALTSWLVVRSMFFTRSACSTVKPVVASDSSAATVAASNGWRKVKDGSSARRRSQRISTRTRCLMSAYSEK
mmetsp:Transcript_1814/g.2880  ORF Transcript_1814/g.2880 Transcript_1814/m.2880 type:complete len:252 (+) Transcript_1814:923-1678(+)